MLKKIVIIGVVVGLLLYGGAEVWINNTSESALARKLEKDHPEATDVSARVSLPLLVSLLGDGRIRRVGVTASHVRVGTVPVLATLPAGGELFADKVNAELTGVRLDKDALLDGKRIQVTSIDHLEITIDISAAEASKAIGLAGLQFEFLENLARVTGLGSVTGGTFQVEGGTRLRFVPNSVTGLPQQLSPTLDLTNLPFAKCAANVEVKLLPEGLLRVKCSQDNPPLNPA